MSCLVETPLSSSGSGPGHIYQPRQLPPPPKYGQAMAAKIRQELAKLKLGDIEDENCFLVYVVSTDYNYQSTECLKHRPGQEHHALRTLCRMVLTELCIQATQEALEVTKKFVLQKYKKSFDLGYTSELNLPRVLSWAIHDASQFHQLARQIAAVSAELKQLSAASNTDRIVIGHQHRLVRVDLKCLKQYLKSKGVFALS